MLKPTFGHLYNFHWLVFLGKTFKGLANKLQMFQNRLGIPILIWKFHFEGNMKWLKTWA